jgi:hypothetical protein
MGHAHKTQRPSTVVHTNIFRCCRAQSTPLRVCHVYCRHILYMPTTFTHTYIHTYVMIIMSMGCDCVSELRPPAGLLLILQVIYEYREPWWNDIDRGKLLIRPPELSGSPILVTTERRVHRLLMKAWGMEGCCHGQPIRGGPQTCGLITPYRKTSILRNVTQGL